MGPPGEPGVSHAHCFKLVGQLLHLPGQAWEAGDEDGLQQQVQQDGVWHGGKQQRDCKFGVLDFLFIAFFL